ncbi:6090_t:CDS:2, partial [Cetraspora pellucida]
MPPLKTSGKNLESENSNLQEDDNYEFMRGNIYKEKDVLLSRSCSLGEKILIGAGSEIAENVKITNSVISRRVTRGPNVEIDSAYIWDDLKIKSNYELSDSDESTTEEEYLKEFFKEASQTLERAFLDGHTVEIALLELNTLRMASNTTFHYLRVS